jgi:hypothetical protein
MEQDAIDLLVKYQKKKAYLILHHVSSEITEFKFYSTNQDRTKKVLEELKQNYPFCNFRLYQLCIDNNL